MPTPKNATRTLAEVRAECIALGVQPGRSIAECETRIAERKAAQAERAADAARIETEFAQIGAWPQGVKALPDPVPDNAPPLTEKTRERERAKRVARMSPALAAPYGEPEAKRAEADRVAEKNARHAASYGSGAALFLAATAALGTVPPTSPAMREQARSFDAPKPKDQVRRDVRRKMRKATRQAQRRAGR